MPSNLNESTQSCGLYKPPHLRAGYEKSILPLNNNTSKAKNNNVRNTGNGKSFMPSTKRNVFNFGLSSYFDWKFKGSHTDYLKKLEESTTVYVGNLNLFSSEFDIHKLFSNAGSIKTIIMGLEKKTLSPAGFCFIEYETRKGAENCMAIMNNALLDGKKMFVDWDAGFIEGRQFKRNNRNLKGLVMYPSNPPKINSNLNGQEEDQHL